MARSRETKIELTAYDDLFQTDESREEAKLSKIRDIPISEIDEFPDHPFKVLMDEDMEQLVESIKRNGVMTPATVRLRRYSIFSGVVLTISSYRSVSQTARFMRVPTTTMLFLSAKMKAEHRNMPLCEALSVTQFWYQHRCPKQRSLKSTANGKRTVSM